MKQDRHSLLYRHLATTLNAGFDMHQALEMSAQAVPAAMAGDLRAVSQDVRRGRSLAEACAKRPKTFGRLDLGVIRTAENSGALPDLFLHLAKWYELKTRIRQTIVSGLIYPGLLVHIAIIAMPLPILFAVSGGFWPYLAVVTRRLLVVYGLCAAVYGGYRLADSDHPVRRFIDKALLKVPFLGVSLRDLAMARYTGGFLAMFRAGAAMDACAAAALQTCGNTAVAGWFAPGLARVKQGDLLSNGFSDKLPHTFITIWRTGEISGRLEHTLEKLAADLFERATFEFKTFANWLKWLVGLVVMLAVAASIISQFKSVMHL